MSMLNERIYTKEKEITDDKLPIKIEKLHRSLVVNENGRKRYKILKDYSGTYIEDELKKSEKMVDPIFRVFEAAKPSRGRKLNIDLSHNFDPYIDSLLDYASIISYKLKKPWTKFNRLIGMQIPFCPNDCWHCFLPKKLYDANDLGNSRFKELPAREIIEKFKKQRDADLFSGKESNVLRISGGEPFLLPDLILECLNILKDENLDKEVFIWTETNLEPFIKIDGQSFMGTEDNNKILKEISSFNNIAVHPCFHGLDEVEFSNITERKETITLDHQIEAIKLLVNAGIDIYPTIGSNVCNPKNLNILFTKLFEIEPTLPFKVALVNYNLSAYPTVSERVLSSNRSVSLYPHYTSLKIWNDLMIKNFGIGYGVVPRNLAHKLTEPLFSNTLSHSEYKSERMELFIFKGSFREKYHREMLEILAYPNDHIVEIVYDKKWIQDDLFVHINLAANMYKGMRANLFYVDSIKSGIRSILPIKQLELISVEHDADLLKIKFRLKGYLKINSQKDAVEYSNITTNILSGFFGDKSLPKEKSGLYTLLGEALLKKSGEGYEVSSFYSPKKIPAVLDDTYLNYRNVIRNIAICKNMTDSLFYKVDCNSLKKLEENERTIYEIKAGSQFKIELKYFIPDSKNLTEDERRIQFKSNSLTIKPIGPDNIILSEYGKNDLIFIAENISRKEEVTIIFWNEQRNYKAPKIQLDIRIKPRKIKQALLSTIGAVLLSFTFIFTSLFTESLKDPAKLGKFWLSFKNTISLIFSQGLGFLLTIVMISFIFYLIFYINSSGYSIKPN